MSKQQDGAFGKCKTGMSAKRIDKKHTHKGHPQKKDKDKKPSVNPIPQQA